MKSLVALLVVASGIAHANGVNVQMIDSKPVTTKMVEFDVKITAENCDQASTRKPDAVFSWIVGYGNYLPIDYQLVTLENDNLAQKPGLNVTSMGNLGPNGTSSNGLVLTMNFSAWNDSRLMGSFDPLGACKVVARKLKSVRVRALKIE